MGKVVLITGGAKGIGRAIALELAKNQYDIVINYLTSNQEAECLKEHIIQQYHVRCLALKADVSKEDQVKKMIQEIDERLGGVDILINNAGISSATPLTSYTEEELDKIININIKSVFLCSKVAVPYMKEQGNGVILNTSSMVSIYGQPSGCMYPASKFAVNGLTKSLARELAPLNIRVNAVAPGITETDMVSALPKEVIEPLIKTIPLGKIGKPIDIANAFLYLASDMANYTTGEILHVDGAARS